MMSRPLRFAVVRGAWYFGIWLVLLPSLKVSDLAIGLAAAAAAASVSLRLLPPSAGRLNLGALLALLPHFAWESVVAGVDVARRAFSRRMPLAPGFVDCPMAFAPGLARNAFASITSLLPGTVAVGDGDEALVYHCLDVAQPVVEQLREEERLLARALVVDG